MREQAADSSEGTVGDPRASAYAYASEAAGPAAGPAYAGYSESATAATYAEGEYGAAMPDGAYAAGYPPAGDAAQAAEAVDYGYPTVEAANPLQQQLGVNDPTVGVGWRCVLL